MPRIETLIDSQNICDLLDDDELGVIGRRVIDDFEKDKESMSEWLRRNEEAFRIIDHDFNNKAEPWDGAANAKLPLIMGSAVKFQSEAGAEIIKGHEAVKTEIFGEPNQEKRARSDRVKAHMNYQLFHEMDNWDGDMDHLLLCLPIVGCIHKKVYFDPAEGKNVSEMCLDNVFIHQDSTSPRKARVSQEFTRDKNRIHENEAAGIWREIEYTSTGDTDHSEEDGVQEFIEQHRRLDLDGDGYEEPYIVTVHKDCEKPVRIVANFRAEDVEIMKGKVAKVSANCQFVKYEFIPSPDGSYWSYGWGLLLGPLNDNINTIVNQLLDAGTLSNLQGGWISASVRSTKGDTRFKPGEFKTVKVTGGTLRDSVLPLPTKEPSNTLFLLMQLLIEQVRDFTSVTDIVAGDVPHANMAEGSILALIEQGKKTFNAIYKRIYRSLKGEFKKLFALNLIYSDPAFYAEFFDRDDVNPTADYEFTGYDILPTANPEFASRTQRIVQAEALMPLLGHPEANRNEILRRYVTGVVDNEEDAAIIIPDENQPTPEQMMAQVEQFKQEVLAQHDVRQKELESQIKEMELQMAALKLSQVQTEAPEKTDQAILRTEEAALRVDLAQAHVDGAKEQENNSEE